MKLSTVNILAGILSGIKINKIVDKNVKATLVNDYIYLRKFAKEADEQRRELTEKFQADWAEELEAVQAFRRDNKPVVGHKEYLEAEADANKAIQDIFSTEVEVKVKPVKMEAFLSACGGEELTFEQIAVLSESGIIE